MTLLNNGNVPDTNVILSTTTLGPATKIGGGFLANINPGANGTFAVTFKKSDVGKGVLPLTFQGTYDAAGVTGIPWSISYFVLVQ